jgi:GT2 family glycosyltransferase
MKIRYCIVTLNQFEWVVDKHLPSLDPQLIAGVHLLVSETEEQTYHDEKFLNPLDVAQLAEQSERFGDFRVTAVLQNFGVANAWNYFTEQAEKDGYDAVIVANDDIYLYDGVLERFVEKMQNNEFVCFEGQNAFSFYGMHVTLFNRVGKFDENFWPAYYEDNDYHYRMKLLGLPTAYVAEPSYFHQVSATITKFDYFRKMMHHHNFRKNTAYYTQKWGGLPHNEQFTEPFSEEGVDHDQSQSAESAFGRFESSSH